MSETIMTCAECDELFADYFEQQLGEAKHNAVESHVSTCARCQGLVRDFDRIQVDAAELADLVPSRDLWKGIEARIQPSVRSIAAPRYGVGMSRGWMAAAAAALVVVSSSVTYVTTKSTSPTKPAAANAVTTGTAAKVAAPPAAAGSPARAGSAESENRAATVTPRAPSMSLPARTQSGRSATFASASTEAVGSEFERAIADEIGQLQALLVDRRADLAPETVRVVEENLAIIDAAVLEARNAVMRDPGSGFLSKRLESALQKKVQLLRTVALLPAST